jgi:hypothetical protein
MNEPEYDISSPPLAESYHSVMAAYHAFQLGRGDCDFLTFWKTNFSTEQAENSTDPTEIAVKGLEELRDICLAAPAEGVVVELLSGKISELRKRDPSLIRFWDGILFDLPESGELNSDELSTIFLSAVASLGDLHVVDCAVENTSTRTNTPDDPKVDAIPHVAQQSWCSMDPNECFIQ